MSERRLTDEEVVVVHRRSVWAAGVVLVCLALIAGVAIVDVVAARGAIDVWDWLLIVGSIFLIPGACQSFDRRLNRWRKAKDYVNSVRV